MLQQVNFVRTAQLDKKSEMIIKLSDNLEFTLYRNRYTHDIKHVKGDFEITKITECYGEGQPNELKYDKSSTSFKASDVTGVRILTFYITAMIEMDKIKDMDEIKEMCGVKYQLQIPFERLQCLEMCRFFKGDFVLPGYDGLKFAYFVKKEFSANYVEVHIKNPYDVEIQGKKGDFNIAFDSTKSIDFHLLFNFYTDKIPVVEKTERKSDVFGLPQESSIDESRPESVVSSFLSKVTTLLHKLATNNQFADVYFISSDGEKILSHRNILAASSDIFAAIFEDSTEIPIQITADDFDAQTIQSAVSFLYDKPDAIYGKEMEAFKFAVKFGIHDLVDACVSFFVKSVNPTNVCEFIQIAYSNNFEELKQKCLKILVQKKDEIDSTKVAAFPKNIFFDIFKL